MVFSSPIFLFLFLPLTLAGYYLIDRRLKNFWLLAVSLAFYAYGEPKFVYVMLVSILLNHCLALGIDHFLVKYGEGGRKKAKVLLTLAVLLNISIFFVYKYLNFTIENLNIVGSWLNYRIPQTNIVLPIGISFFTFQIMSYVFDVYYRTGKVQKNPLNTALYIALFPQLIAGPIVRYQTVADEINERKETLEDFTKGINRFIIGLTKKVLLSNQLALAADFAHNACADGTITTSLGWLGAVAYSLQILFDFSGYSDMAIGLGLMFGFHFDENFNAPYASLTVSEFWRRWHISLGSWFRDYVYFPMGGSRVSTKRRQIFNLFVVWALTGVWHGANWTFILWGMYFFVLLTGERMLGIDKRLRNAHLAARQLYRGFMQLCIVISFVLFRASDLGYAWRYMKAMFGFAPKGLSNATAQWMWAQYAVVLLVAVFACMDWKKIRSKWKVPANVVVLNIMDCVKMFVCLALALISICFIVAGTYNPFIYFNF